MLLEIVSKSVEASYYEVFNNGFFIGMAAGAVLIIAGILIARNHKVQGFVKKIIGKAGH